MIQILTFLLAFLASHPVVEPEASRSPFHSAVQSEEVSNG